MRPEPGWMLCSSKDLLLLLLLLLLTTSFRRSTKSRFSLLADGGAGRRRRREAGHQPRPVSHSSDASDHAHLQRARHTATHWQVQRADVSRARLQPVFFCFPRRDEVPNELSSRLHHLEVMLQQLNTDLEQVRIHPFLLLFPTSPRSRALFAPPGEAG